MAKDALTKEAITRLFPDNFQLTTFAIKNAQQQIQSGNDELNVTDLLEQIRKKEEKKRKKAQQQQQQEQEASQQEGNE